MEKNKQIIVALIVKREYNYIREHIEYHLNLGFDKVYVGDNNNDNDEHYEDLLSDLIESGKVEILNYRYAPSQQIKFYNYIIENIDYEWCAFIDCDEFLTFNKDSKYTNIKDFLHSNNEIKNYHVNWMVYGDNEQCYKQNGGVVDRFITPKDNSFEFGYNFPENRHIKTILHKESDGRFINPHSVLIDNAYSPSGKKVHKGFFSDIDHSVLYIRHFYTKSLEEWVTTKMLRKGGNNTNINYGLEVYFAYNEMTKEKKDFLDKMNLKINKNIEKKEKNNTLHFFY